MVTQSGEKITEWQIGRLSPMPSHVPSGWELLTLISVAKLESGHTPSRRRPEYWKGDIPWISLHDSGALDVPEIAVTAQTIGPIGLANSSARLLPKGTVVFSRTATIGKATVMARAMATSQDFANYICGERVHNHFLVHLFRYMAPEWKRLMAGSTHNSIYMPVFRDLQILLPPIREQEAVAEALNAADAQIESLEQLTAKKRNLKQGAMQELLSGKKRLPGLTGAWGFKSVGELGESLNGLTYKPSDVRSDGMLVLRSSNVQGGVLRYDDNVFVEMGVPERIILKEGDILVCVRNGSRDLIGKCAKIGQQGQRMTFGAFMAVVRTPFHDFVYHQFQSDVIKRQIHQHLGATINQITNKSLNSFQIPFPADQKERNAIATLLDDMDVEIAALEATLAKARDIKQGMMQNLLTGRIRLV